MYTLCFHLTDIVSNCIRAGATQVWITIAPSGSHLHLTIADNGCGMDAEALARATNPFYTTRTTRRVGFGLALLKQVAELTGGSLSITSTVGKGTEVAVHFVTTSIDCPPIGNLPESLALLLGGNPAIHFTLTYQKEEASTTLTSSEQFSLTSSELSEALDGLPLNHPQSFVWIKELLEELLPPHT